MTAPLSKDAIARFVKPQKLSEFRIFTHPKRRWLKPEERAEIVRLRNTRMTLREIAKATGRHLATVWAVVSAATARGECIGGRMRRAKP